jgi:hypothetical protein
MVKSLSAEMEKMKMEGKPTYKIPKILKTEATSGGQTTILLRLCQGNKGIEIETIRKSRLPLQNNLVIDEEGKKKSLTLKFIVLETPPHFLI